MVFDARKFGAIPVDESAAQPAQTAQQGLAMPQGQGPAPTPAPAPAFDARDLGAIPVEEAPEGPRHDAWSAIPAVGLYRELTEGYAGEAARYLGSGLKGIASHPVYSGDMAVNRFQSAAGESVEGLGRVGRLTRAESLDKMEQALADPEFKAALDRGQDVVSPVTGALIPAETFKLGLKAVRGERDAGAFDRPSMLEEAGQSAQAAAERGLQDVPKDFQDSPAGQIAGGLGSTGVYLGPQGLIMGVGAGANQQAKDYRQSMQEQGKAPTREGELEAASYGGALGSIEFLPVTRILGRAKRLAGSGATKRLEDALQTFMARAKQYGKDVAVSGLEEGVQEFIQGVGQNVIAKDLMSYDEAREYLGPDINEQTYAGMGAGALLSAVLGLPGLRRGRGEADADPGSTSPMPEQMDSINDAAPLPGQNEQLAQAQSTNLQTEDGKPATSFTENAAAEPDQAALLQRLGGETQAEGDSQTYRSLDDVMREHGMEPAKAPDWKRPAPEQAKRKTLLDNLREQYGRSAQQRTETAPEPPRGLTGVLQEQGYQPPSREAEQQGTVPRLIEENQQRRQAQARRQEEVAPYSSVLEQLRRENSEASQEGVDRNRDDLLAAIAKRGGLDPDALGGEVDIATMRQMSSVGRPVVRKLGEGQTLDHMAETLAQDGFTAPDGSPLDPNSLAGLIDSASRGERIFPTSSDRAGMIDPDNLIAKRWFQGAAGKVENALQKYVDGRPLTPNQQGAVDDITDYLRGNDGSIYRERDIAAAQDLDPLTGERPSWYGEIADMEPADAAELMDDVSASSLAQEADAGSLDADDAAEHASARALLDESEYQAPDSAVTGLDEVLVDYMMKAARSGATDEQINQALDNANGSRAAAIGGLLALQTGEDARGQEPLAAIDWRYEQEAGAEPAGADRPQPPTSVYESEQQPGTADGLGRSEESRVPSDRTDQARREVEAEPEPPASDSPVASEAPADAGVSRSGESEPKKWKKDGKRLWRSSDGMIITDESMTVGGARQKNYFVYENAQERDRGNNFASAESYAEAKRKAESGPDLELQQQTEESRAAEQSEQRQVEARRQQEEQEAEQRRQADSEAGDFRLSGSNRPADVATAGGQQDLESVSSRQDNQAADGFEERMREMASSFEGIYNDKPLAPLALDLANHAIETNARRLTQAERAQLANKHGVTENIVDELARQPFGIEGLRGAAQRGDKGAKALRERAREAAEANTPKESDPSVEQELATAAAETDTSPSEAQIEADNYKKGRIRIQGLDIAIENPKGSTRSGTAPDGTRWETSMAHHYGDIKRTEGADGDNVDVFIGPNPDSASVFIIDQVDADGSFDEHKVMLGFPNQKAARDGYRANYEKGWKVGPTTKMTMDQFKDWLVQGDTTRPVKRDHFPDARKKVATPEKPSQPIEDFGEKLEGARKDMAGKLADAAKRDTAEAPLSESWPQPDYQKMLDDGFSLEAVSVLRVLRDAVPAKPRHRGKKRMWAKKVEVLRGLAMEILGNPDAAAKVRSELESISTVSGLSGAVDLYMTAGHDQSLKGLTLSAAAYSIYDGVPQNPSKTVWEVRKQAKVTGFSNMPRVIAKGDTKEQALNTFKKAVASLEDKAPKSKKPVRFDIYSRRGQEGWLVGKKVGRDYVDLERLDSPSEAREYLANNQDALEAKLAKIKEVPDHRKENNSPRVGASHRNGDVTPEQFAEEFGFRGVQFGNWVEQGRRQQDLNEAYDALMDLAGILNVPARAISLGGELGLAFGARGKGGKNPAKAHYEPARIVINLTKKDGAGSLAHEWWHALDNYFTRERDSASDSAYATEGAAHVSVRPEVRQAFKSVTQAVNRTRIKQRSQKLDKTRTKAYWSTGREMSARAFESYVIEQLRDQGAANDYLANIVSPEYWKAAEALTLEKEDTYPYPEAAEVPAIREAFDNFFQVVETKEDDQGNVALFSQAESKPVRTGWQPNFPKAVISLGSKDFQKHPDYRAAKEGDIAAAVRLAKDSLKQGDMVKIKRLAKGVKGKPVLVPVHAEEAVSVNQIPVAATAHIGQELGWDVDESIVQTEKIGRGDGDGFYRLANQPHFVGEVEPGRSYVLLDDTLTQGGTFAALKGHIEANGGNVIGVVAMSGKQYSSLLAPTSDTLEALRKRWPDLEGWWNEQFGYGFDRLTESEARYLARVRVPSLDALRDRVLAAQQARVSRGSPPPTGQGPLTSSTQSPETRPSAGFSASGLQKTLRKAVGQRLADSIEVVQSVSDLPSHAGLRSLSGASNAVDSPAFRRWFGDSKVVDANGKPLVMYHGTLGDFGVFVPSVQSGGLIFFTEDAGVASEYAEGGRSGYSEMWRAEVRAGVSILARENPRHFDGLYLKPGTKKEALSVILFDSNEGRAEAIGARLDSGIISPEQAISQFNAFVDELGSGGNVMPVYVRAERPANSKNNPMPWKRAEELGSEHFQSQGYDSVYVTEADGVALAVFDSSQAKSATGNRGTFGPDNPDIRESRAADRVEGMYDPASGKVYLVADNIPSEERAAWVAWHELWHRGVRSIDGRRGKLPGSQEGQALNQALNRAGLNKSVKQLADAIMRDRGMAEADRRIATEEALAELNAADETGDYRAIERRYGVKVPQGMRSGIRGHIDRFLDAVRRVLAKLTGRAFADVSNREVWQIVTGARAGYAGNVEGGAGGGLNSVAPEQMALEAEADGAIPEETRFRAMQRKFQDRFNRFTVIQEWLDKGGANLSEQANVYKAEERMHGRVAAKMEDFAEKTVRPLIKKISKAGYSMEDIGRYLHARHAAERNAQIAKINKALPDGGSGMTNAEARAVMAQFDGDADFAALADEVRAITKSTRQVLLDAGIVTQEQVDHWDEIYPNYVPLKGGPDAKLTNSAGKGLTVNGKIKRAMGHSKRDDGEWIIENILSDHQMAIMSAEKNRVGQHLLHLIVEGDDDRLFTVDKPEKRGVLRNSKGFALWHKGRVVGAFSTRDEAETALRENQEKTKDGLATYAIEETNDPAVVYMARPQLAENETSVYVDGHAVRIQFHDELLARAWNRLGDERLGWVLEKGRELNAHFSRVYTGYNPEFLLTNMVRDFTTGVANAAGEEGVGMAVRSVAAYPGTFAQLIRYAATGRESDLIREFRADGGTTGAAWLGDLERTGKDVQRAYDDALRISQLADVPGKSRKVATALRRMIRPFVGWIEAMNQAGENAYRLAAHKAMRDVGKTRAEAASLAKNVTVNFNRKGEAGASANALYLFFNASMQGSAAIAHAHFKGKYKEQAWAVSAGLMAAGFMYALAQGGADDEEWEGVPEWEKERNIMLKTKDGWAKLPLPYGHGWFWSTGRHMADRFTGKVDNQEAAMKIAASFMDEFTIFGPSLDGGKLDGDNKLFLAPTLVQIALVDSVNRTSMGRDVYPENAWDKGMPDSQKFYRGTKGTVFERLTTGMNKATGGDAVKGGAVDVSPETMKYLWRTFTGGAGSFVSDTLNMGVLAAQGVQVSDFESREIPILRRFYRDTDVRDVRNRYYTALNEAREAGDDLARAKRVDRINRDFDMTNIEKYKPDTDEERTLHALGRVGKTAATLLKQKRELQVATMLDEEKPIGKRRLEVKRLEKEEAELMEKVLATMNK